MKRALVFCIGLALTPSAVAFGAGLDLFWNDCSAGPASSYNKVFACDTNAGVGVIVASFDPPDGITKLVGCRAVLELRFAPFPVFPSWWQFGAGGCREGSMAVSVSPPASELCFDTWSGAATGELEYSANFGGDPTRARVEVSIRRPEATAGPVTAGNSYHAFSLIIDRLNTVGSGACTGCLTPTCITLNEISLYQSPGLSDYRLQCPRLSNFVAWQGGAVGGSACPGSDPPPPCVTPVLNRTWGGIKSIYR
jgi:hypothetical protein